MQSSMLRTMAPVRAKDLASCSRRPLSVNTPACTQIRKRAVLRIVHAHNTPEPCMPAEPIRPAPLVAQLAAGAAVAWALLSCDRAEAADSSGRISGSTFASRRTAVQANSVSNGSVATTSPSSASFTRNSTNVNESHTNVNHSTTNVNHTSVNHTTTHVNHTTVVVAPSPPIIPIPVPVMAPVVAAPVMVAEPVVVAGGSVVAATPTVVTASPVVVTHQSSMVTTVIGLLAVVLLLYIIAQVISAFSGNRY